MSGKSKQSRTKAHSGKGVGKSGSSSSSSQFERNSASGISSSRSENFPPATTTTTTIAESKSPAPKRASLSTSTSTLSFHSLAAGSSNVPPSLDPAVKLWNDGSPVPKLNTTLEYTFIDMGNIYKKIVGGPRKNRFERWASERTTTPGRYAAKSAVTTGNFFADHPYVMFGVWGALWLMGIFYKWGLAQSLANGGRGSATNVFVHAVTDALEALAVGAVVTLFYSFSWKKLRGPKRPDPKPFKEYISKLKQALDHDEALKRIVTDPKKPLNKLSRSERFTASREWIEACRLALQHRPHELLAFNKWLDEAHPTDINQHFETWYQETAKAECETCVKFHKSMIKWLADGADQPTEGEQDPHGLWEAIGYLMQNFCEYFPFYSADGVAAVPGSQRSLETVLPSILSGSHQQEQRESDAQGAASSLKERSRDAALGGMAGAGHAGMTAGELFGTNANLLNAVTRDLRAKGKEEEDVSGSASHVDTLVSHENRLLQPGKDDIYNWPLINNDEEGFYTVVPEERQRAQKQSWEARHVTSAKAAISRDDISLRLASYLEKKTRDREGVFSEEGKKARQVDIVKNYLNGFLSDPGECDAEQLWSCCLLLVTYLRPVIDDGQWKNWRYFLAHDDIVTEAFKALPIQKRLWMVRTLVSGNDAGKLLALSILQDSRIPVTRFNHAEDRSVKTAVKDAVWDNSLASFFQAYIALFGGDDFISTPDDYYKFCQELFFLTNNGEGQVSELLSHDTFIGAQILRNFTNPGAMPSSNYLVRQFGEPNRVMRDRQVVQDIAGQHYQAREVKQDGQLGFSFLPNTTREQVTQSLLSILEQKDSDDPEVADKYKKVLIILKPEITGLFHELRQDSSRIGSLPKELLPYISSYDQEWCDFSEVAKAYIIHAIAGHQPLGSGVAISYAMLKGHLVQTWQKEVSGKIKAKSSFGEGCEESQETINILIDTSDPTSFSILTTEIDPETAVRLEQTEPEKTFSSAEKQPACEAWPAHAQRLFWSMSNVDMQVALVRQLDFGNPVDATEGALGSSDALYSLKTSASREAIKTGVLKTKSMEGLAPLLLSSDQNKQEQGYRILAMLLSDRSDTGMGYQKAYQHFIKRHYDSVSTKAHFEKFFDVLSRFDLNEAEKDTAVSRYAAALVSAEESDYDKHADLRAEKILELFKEFFPNPHLLHVFNRIAFCFHEDAAWEARRRIFNLVFRYLRSHRSASGDYQANFSTLCFRSAVSELMAGDITEQQTAFNSVHSTGDLLSSIIQITYKEDSSLLEPLQDLTQSLHNENLSLNLMLAVASGLRSLECDDAYITMNDLLEFFEGVPFEKFNAYFEKLEVRMHKDGPILTLESLYIDMALVFLGRAEAAYLAAAGENLPEFLEVDPAPAERKKAWDCLNRVVAQPALPEKLGLYEYRQIAEILPRLVHPFGTEIMGYNQQPMLSDLAHKTLALFLNRPDCTRMEEHVAQLRTMFERVGKAILADESDDIFVAGVRTLFNAVSEVGEHAIQQRLLTLALYSEFQRMPSRLCSLFPWARGVTRAEVISNLRKILAVGGCDSQENHILDSKLGVDGDLRGVFVELNMEDTCNQISALLQAENNQLTRGSQVRLSTTDFLGRGSSEEQDPLNGAERGQGGYGTAL